jgi:hypothetical protein
MRFLESDEFLLLMVACEKRALGIWEGQHILTVPERIRLREVGIRTVHEQPPWCWIETSKGWLDHTVMERIINRNREAGLKSLIQIPGWRIPVWVPKEWRARQENGTYEEEVLSLWNDEAQAHLLDTMRRLVDVYTAEDVAFFYGEWQGGEGAYPSTWPVYDECALEDYRNRFGAKEKPVPGGPQTLQWFGEKVIEHYAEVHKILYPPYQQVWNCQQRLMDRWTKSFGNFVQPDILQRHRRDYPDGDIVLLQYTYFDPSHDQDCVAFVDKLVEMVNCEVIVEAMFPQGLPETTPKAIRKGFRGQIVHPALEVKPGQHLQDWEVENIRRSHEAWKRHYENK